MTDDAPRKLHELARDRKTGRGRLLHVGAEQVRVGALDLPDHRAGWHAGFREVASCIAPAFEIVGCGESDAVRVDHGTFAEHVSRRTVPAAAPSARRTSAGPHDR